MTKRRAALLVLLPAVLVAGYLGVKTLRADLETVGVGARAPDFAAMTLDSAPAQKTLSDYAGSVVLLNIWATWCGPCRVEMPSIQNLHESYAPRGLKVVAVSVDRGGMEEQIRAFSDSLGLTFEILHDSAGTIQQAYHTSGIPETVVIDRNGTIRKRVSGAIHWDSKANRALVEQLLAPAG